MDFIEKVGRTVDEAVTEALIELGASTDEVNVEVISKGSKGILGFGIKLAKVKVTRKEEPKENIEVNEPQIKTLEKPMLLRKETKKNSEDLVVATPEELTEVISRAESFLYKLLKEMSIEGTINSKVVNNNRIAISIEGNNMGIIIGKRGETLDAIQYIVNIIANKNRDEYIKVMLDTENYRARREETLKKLAYKLSKKAYQTKKPIILEPMNPYDRRIIHAALQDSKIVKTHSEGKEPFRRVVISPSFQNRVYK